MDLWRERVRAYLGEHLSYLALVFFLFFMGIVFGALTVNNLPATERQSLLSYLSGFLRALGPSTTLDKAGLSREAILSNAKTIGFLFLLGLSAIGTPFILLVVFTRGFVLGFTVGFLVKQLMLKGFFFSLVAVVPQNLLFTPALLAAAAANLDLGWTLIRSRFLGRGHPFGHEVLRCLGITGAAFFLLFLAGLVEGYVSPVLITWMARYLS
ncbi:MAG: stage II sporulation protein M [Firmicutes bacterium]|nr:stage II sporulation protein M [Bacillota bacterium]